MVSATLARTTSCPIETRNSQQEIKQNKKMKKKGTRGRCKDDEKQIFCQTLPIAEEGFDLHKQAFKDALSLRYGWDPTRLPNTCVCGSVFTVEHSLSCPNGAFPSIRHDKIRNLTAELLTEVCHRIEVEPHLQPLTGEQLPNSTAITGDSARQDIKAMGFWGNSRQQTFFDVRIFNPFAPSNSSNSIKSIYKKHEREKRRSYERHILEVERGTFTPIVLSTTGGWGPSAAITYKRIASMIAEKQGSSYNQVMKMIRCKISFALIDAAIMCLRGARSSWHKLAKSIDLIDKPADLFINKC